jgi:hypothetical protein
VQASFKFSKGSFPVNVCYLLESLCLVDEQLQLRGHRGSSLRSIGGFFRVSEAIVMLKSSG